MFADFAWTSKHFRNDIMMICTFQKKLWVMILWVVGGPKTLLYSYYCNGALLWTLNSTVTVISPNSLLPHKLRRFHVADATPIT